MHPPPVTYDDDEAVEEFNILRPDCLAKDRLLLWRPSRPVESSSRGLSLQDRAQVTQASVEAFNVSTRATYGAGLKLYMEVCDAKDIPDRDRVPASKELVAVFLAQLVGAYSASAAKNYYSELRAWHIIHGFGWHEDRLQFDVLLRAAVAMALEESTQSKKPPYTVEALEKIAAQLDRAVPLDAVVAATANILFWGLGRLGELTVKKQKEYSPLIHVRITDFSESVDRDGNPVWSLRIPRTKVAPRGERLQWGRQTGLMDAVAAMENHIAVNNPGPQEHLFTYQTVYKNGRRRRIPLVRDVFVARIRSAAREAGVPSLAGHAFRVGGTLEYLLRKVPFEVVKSHGRWKGDAFQLYLRKHSQILAPYLQAVPELQAAFIGSMLPRVR